MVTVEELRREYRRFIARLMIDCPFLALLMKYTPVYVMPERMRGISPMYTDGKAVYVDVDSLSERSPADRLFIYAHEVMHIMMMHVMRSKRLVNLLKNKGYVINHSIKKLINLCSDAEVNKYVSELLKYRPDDAVIPINLSPLVDEPEKKSFERMVLEILEKAELRGLGMRGDLTDITDRMPDCSTDLPIEGKCGGKFLSGEGGDNVSGNVGKEVYRNYTRPSKKYLDSEFIMPSKRNYGLNRITVLVDTSGSIGLKELRQFVTEIYEISRTSRSEVVVIPWDAEAYDPIVIKSPNDAKKINLRGGGGTIIYPALKKAIELRADVNVILSDFDIYDIGRKDVLNTLRKLRNLVMVTTDSEPPKIPGATSVRISFGD